MPMLILAILLSVVASSALGFWWYSEQGFGKPWVKMMGLDPKKMKEHNKDMNKTYGLMLVGSFIQAFILSQFLSISVGLGFALTTAFWLWLGFVFPTQLVGHLFSGRKFQPTLLAIDSGYQLASLLVMATILTLL